MMVFIYSVGKWRSKLKQEDLPSSCNYMIISDHLDMVGVELQSTWTQTRKANGDIMQKRVSNTINPWKAGKFMPVTMRPWSINSFALSKVWFRCHSVNLRASDVTAITSCVKSWLYADMFEKPSEVIMFRPPSYGGLGILSPKYRATACLIRSFMETAANPNFRRNHYHDQLFRYHVLAETSLPDPGFPPYYPPEFFATIKKVKDETPLNITTMSTSQWSRVLVEDNLTMITLPDTTREFAPSRVELANPDTNWQQIWYFARLKGLGPDHTSFLWKLVHQLLPIKERLHRLSSTTSSLCTLCNENKSEDLTHAFYTCNFNQGAGQELSRVLKQHLPNITMENIMQLVFEDLSEEMEFPVVWFSAAFLLAIWERRTSNKRIRTYEIRAEIEGKISLLRETRYYENVEKLKLLVEGIPIV